MKASIPEIFLGALLAVAIFLMGFAAAHQSSSVDWLAIFTGILAVSTVLLWLATLQSARTAERALTELERSFVGIKIISSELTDLDQLERGDIPNNHQFCFVNYGRTPATITQLADQLVLRPPGQSPEPFDITTKQNKFPEFGIIIGPNNGESPASSRSYYDQECIPTP